MADLLCFLEMITDEEELMAIEQKQSSCNFMYLANNKRRSTPKVRSYEEVLSEIKLYRNVGDFKMHYRIDLDMFNFLLGELHQSLERHNRGGSAPVPPEKQLLVFLNFIGNQQSMRECGHFFGLSISTVHDVINRVLDAVLDLQARIVQWPSAQKQQQTAREVEDRYGIPGVIGFIDGTHIRLASAPDSDRDYYNRKGFPSMQLQVVADSSMLIISAYTGWPGCTHDARVLRNSTLYQKAEEGQAIIQNHHILADNAYPLRNWLISPFKNYGHLTPQQQRYNTKLSGAKQTVERCFAHLKGRFRRLKEVTFHDPRQIAKLIMAGCILHNLCVIHTDDIEEFMDNNAVLEDAGNECENIYQHGVHGVARRLRLLQQV